MPQERFAQSHRAINQVLDRQQGWFCVSIEDNVLIDEPCSPNYFYNTKTDIQR